MPAFAGFTSDVGSEVDVAARPGRRIKLIRSRQTWVGRDVRVQAIGDMEWAVRNSRV